MGKYFDELMKMNESLDNELKDKGLYKEGNEEDMVPVPADSLTDDQKAASIEQQVVDAGLKAPDKDTLGKLVKDPEAMSAVTEILAGAKKNESSNLNDLSKMDWDGPAIIKKEGEDSDSFYVKDKEWSSDIQNAYEFPSKEDAFDKIEQLGGDYLFIWPASMKKEGLDESINEAEGEVYLRMDDDDLDIHGFVQWDEENVNFTEDESEADVFVSKADAEATILDICDKFNYDPETFTTQEVDSQVADNGDNWVSLDPTDATATTIA